MTRPARVACCGIADVLLDALDLAQDRVERVLQRAVDRVALRRPQLVEVGVDPLARLQLALPVTAAQVARDVLPRENRLGDVVGKHRARTISNRRCLLPHAARRQIGVGELGRRRRAAEIARPDRAGREHARSQRRADPLARAPARRCDRASSAPTAAARSGSPGSGPRCPARCRARPRTPPISVPRFAPGTTPSPPTSPAHRSDTMSP